MTTAQKPRTLTRQVSQLGEVRFDGDVWVDAIYGSPGGLGHVLSQKITVRVDGPDAIPVACALGDPHTTLCQLDRAGGPPRDAAELCGSEGERAHRLRHAEITGHQRDVGLGSAFDRRERLAHSVGDFVGEAAGGD